MKICFLLFVLIAVVDFEVLESAAQSESLIHKVVDIEGSEVREVRNQHEIRYFSGVGALTYKNERGTFTGKGSAFTFRLDGDPDVYVAAAAHEIYDRGSWTFGTRPDGTPDRENLYIYSDVCRAGYRAKRGTLRVGSTEIDAGNADQSLELRARDWLVFKLAEKPCTAMAIYQAIPFTGNEFEQIKQLQVAGLHDNSRHGQKAVTKEYSLCKPKGFQGQREETVLFHGCSTRKGVSGAPILIVRSSSETGGVIGIHTGASDISWGMHANEGVLFTPEFLSTLAK